jgi:signal transduction histidine kinase
MNIRARLSVTFFAIVIVVLTVASVTIYFFAESHRKVDFYRRLKSRALHTAQVLIETKEVNAALQQRLEENNPASLPDQYIVIIDSTGHEIYRSTGADLLNIDTAMLNDVRNVGEIEFTKDHREGLGFIYNTSQGYYIVLATAFDQYGIDEIDNLRSILILTLLAGVVIVSALSWFYSGRVLKPISKLISEVSSITEKNLNQRLDEGDQKDELAQLAKTFNAMLSRLQNSFLSQKSFIANASHEIKTPITIMSGEIEVTLMHEREGNYYKSTLQSVLKGLKRLNTLSTQLLLLAESSNQTAERKFTSFRLDDVLWETKEWLVKAFPHYHVDIHFDLGIDAEAFSTQGDEHLVRAAILNLMDNGCKYSPDNHVSIIVDTKTKDWITLTFVNTGTIQPDEIPKLFSPFYRSPSNTTEKGFGIGLSLVNNVVRLHKAKLEVTSSGPGATVASVQFTLRLPLKATNQDSGTTFQPPPRAR